VGMVKIVNITKTMETTKMGKLRKKTGMVKAVRPTDEMGINADFKITRTYSTNLMYFCFQTLCTFHRSVIKTVQN
jgi:hypothetical protein